MSTKNRRRISNVFLLISALLAAALWIYGTQMAREACEQEHRNRAWRDIIDHSSAAVIVSDAEGHIVQWSDGARDMLGWSRNEAEGADLQLIMPPDRREIHAIGFCDENKRRQLAEGGVLQIHGYAITSDGQIIKVDIRITAVRNGATYYVAQITLAAEALEEPLPIPPPAQMQYSPPNIQEFRS